MPFPRLTMVLNGELLTEVYDELHRLASSFLRNERPNHTLQPSALINEAYMRMVKQDNGTARIAMLQKELRGSIKQIQDERYVGDKQGLILAGADRALREIVLIFKDDPIEGPLQDAVMAVWTKILSEES